MSAPVERPKRAAQSVYIRIGSLSLYRPGSYSLIYHEVGGYDGTLWTACGRQVSDEMVAVRRDSAVETAPTSDAPVEEPAAATPEPEPAKPSEGIIFYSGLLQGSPVRWTLGTDMAMVGPTLAAKVAAQVAELTADFEGATRAELPKPPVDDTYASAYASAVKNCDHPANLIQDTLYGREWQCQQCGKFFDRTTLPRRGGFWGLFS